MGNPSKSPRLQLDGGELFTIKVEDPAPVISLIDLVSAFVSHERGKKKVKPHSFEWFTVGVTAHKKWPVIDDGTVWWWELIFEDLNVLWAAAQRPIPPKHPEEYLRAWVSPCGYDLLLMWPIVVASAIETVTGPDSLGAKKNAFPRVVLRIFMRREAALRDYLMDFRPSTIEDVSAFF